MSCCCRSLFVSQCRKGQIEGVKTQLRRGILLLSQAMKTNGSPDQQPTSWVLCQEQDLIYLNLSEASVSLPVVNDGIIACLDDSSCRILLAYDSLDLWGRDCHWTSKWKNLWTENEESGKSIQICSIMTIMEGMYDDQHENLSVIDYLKVFNVISHNKL